RRGERRGPAARLLRLRRRVRPRRDARAAPRLPAQARRRAAAATGAAARGAREGAAATPRARRGAALPLRLRETRGGRVPLAPRRHPRAAARLPAARGAALVLTGLPPQAGHDLRPGAEPRRGEP